jgi:hypothetical protein
VPVTVTANLPEPAVEALERLARRHQSNRTEALRFAISLARKFDDELSAGGRILVQKKDGKFWELELPL